MVPINEDSIISGSISTSSSVTLTLTLTINNDINIIPLVAVSDSREIGLIDKYLNKHCKRIFIIHLDS